MSNGRRGIVLFALGLAGSAFSQNNIMLFDAPGAATTIPVEINAAGTVIGYCARSQSGPHQGFIRHAGGLITLFNAPGSVDTYATGINYAGTIVGKYTDAAGKTHGFLRDARGNFTVLDVPASSYTDATAINDLGDVTGNYQHTYSAYGTTLTRSNIYLRHADGSLTLIEAVGGNATAKSINAHGTIAGDGYIGESGFVRDSGGKVTYFWAVAYVTVTGMNASGVIIGDDYDLTYSDYKPYVRDAMGNLTVFLTDRHETCGAYSINEQGAITGGCYGGQAFVRQPGGAISMFGAPPRWGCQSFTGTGINGAGAVTGTCGTASGAIHGFIRLP
jgi:hypothetical protein